MSYTDWALANPAQPAQVPQLAQQSALAGYQLGQTGAMYSALRGVDLGNVDSVNRAMSGLTQIGMADLASTLSKLSVTRAINSPLARNIGGAIQGSFDQYGGARTPSALNGVQAPPLQSSNAAPAPSPDGGAAAPSPDQQRLLKEAAAATTDLLSYKDPVLREAAAATYRQHFAQEGIPQPFIDEVLGNVSDDAALSQHAAYFADQANGGTGGIAHPTGGAAGQAYLAAQGAPGQPQPSAPPGGGAPASTAPPYGTQATQQYLGANPDVAQAQATLAGPMANPALMAGMAANGYDVSPGLGLAANLTAPLRNETVRAAFAPTLAGVPQLAPGATGIYDADGRLTGQRLIDGSTQTVEQMAQASGQGAANVTTAPAGGHVTTDANGRPTGVEPTKGYIAAAAPVAKAVATATSVGNTATQAYQYTGADGATHAMTGAQLHNADGSFKSNVVDAAGNRVTDANGALQVALSPETGAMLATTAQGEADRSQQLQASFEGSSQRKALIQDLIAAASGDTTTGPGAAKWADYVNEFNRITGQHFDTNQAATTQTINKMAGLIGQTQFASGGVPRSNAGLDAVEITSPGANYSPETIQRLGGVLEGNEDYIQKKQAIWQAYQQQAKAKGLPASYNTFISEFNKYYDPRTFWEPYMTPAQSAQMLQGMSPAERAAYQQGKATSASVDKFFGVQ